MKVGWLRKTETGFRQAAFWLTWWPHGSHEPDVHVHIQSIEFNERQLTLAQPSRHKQSLLYVYNYTEHNYSCFPVCTTRVLDSYPDTSIRWPFNVTHPPATTGFWFYYISLHKHAVLRLAQNRSWGQWNWDLIKYLNLGPENVVHSEYPQLVLATAKI